ncbi:MAG: stage II sporulation protein P [Clostridia bacterium]|nr:stage II sporulation protein P [Clostridia bacterium]
MISIKVCKLSDLKNNLIIAIFAIVLLVNIYGIIVRFIDEIPISFIEKSIQKNICVYENNISVENLMHICLPVNILNSKDIIEKDISLADNNINNELKSDEDVNTNKWNEIISNNDNNIKKEESIKSLYPLSLPYLLKCETLVNGKYKIGNVIINDYTKKKLNFDELEKSLFTKVDNDCKILIYHTHTSESYTGVDKYSDAYRTEDNNLNVVKVGDALKEELNNYGIFVRHDTTTHDYPSYNGAYKSSLKTVESILKKEKYDIIIDVHRDALASNSEYRPTAQINGETVAKLMFVIGTNTAGLKHDNWIENLKFAVAVQQRAEELYPGLFRDLHLSTSRYNQHTSNKSIILEVGATGNTIDEACLAMKYLASVLNAMRIEKN